MSNQNAVFRGTVHGNTIELAGELGLADGQEVTVTVQLPPAEDTPKRLPPGEGIRRSAGAWAEGGGARQPSSEEISQDLPWAELWADRILYDSSVSPTEPIVKGTHLAAEALVAEFEQGRGDEEMLAAHPELSIEDVRALRQYARVPVGLRLSFGAWAEDDDRPKRLPPGEGIRRSAGAWSDDPEGLDEYIRTVYERRRAHQRRPIEP